MASIIQVKGKWRALVRRKGHPNYCRTFDLKTEAERWARGLEAEIDKGNTPAADAVLGRRVAVRELIYTYRRLREAARPISDSSNTHYMLRPLDDYLGALDAQALETQHLVAYCRARSEEDGAGPYTLAMEVGQLATVLRHTASALKIQLPDVVAQARPTLHHFGLIGAGGRRERRPTADELERIRAWLAAERGALYVDIVDWAVCTAMRQSEICRATWGDVDRVKRLLTIHDRKHPRVKAGNTSVIPLLSGAWEVLQRRMPAGALADPIFPIGPKTVSKYFTDACKALQIEDLHFHDLRHEGTSRLFEAGMEIQQVSLVTGHKDWRQLQRYTQLRPEDLHALDGPASAALVPAKRTARRRAKGGAQ